MKDVSGRVSHIQRFSTGDGPGIRTTVFLQGCGLRCGWCHNPEAVSSGPTLLYYPRLCIGCGSCAGVCNSGAHTFADGAHAFDRNLCVTCGNCAGLCPVGALVISGAETTADVVAEIICEDMDYYHPDGGVTLSGGEPLQNARFAAAIAERCRSRGINVIVDTSACVDFSAVELAAPFTDAFYVDIKCATEDDYRKFTGGSLERALANLKMMAANNYRVLLRVPLIPGVNDAPGYFSQIIPRLMSIGLDEAALLPFHRLGAQKYAASGIEYAYGGATLADGAAKRIKNEWENFGFKIKIGG